ncbi:MAG: antitoxin Xre-like helix-turn-helix domain-containing protein [Weeksellaceae bacterium]
MEERINIVEEAAFELQKTGLLSAYRRDKLMKLVRNGISYPAFQKVVDDFSFTIEEWSTFLHLSERTLQRYKKNDTSFDSLQSERILQITLFYQRGIDVFGDRDNFDTWLNTVSIALGNIKPKELLDNSFGISLLDEELIRIEHGVLA